MGGPPGAPFPPGYGPSEGPGPPWALGALQPPAKVTLVFPNLENGQIFKYWVCGLKILGSGGRLWALLLKFLYNKVLVTGLMGSWVAPEPPLARSRVKILGLFAEITFFGEPTTPGGRARHGSRTPRAPWGPWGPHGGPLGAPRGPLGPWGPWAQTRVTFAGGVGPSLELSLAPLCCGWIG